MGRKKKRQFTPDFKAKVVLEALRERQSLAELSQKYSLQATQISAWKKQFTENSALIFEKPEKTEQKLKEKEQHETLLYEEIGRLKVQLDWLKKNRAFRLSKSVCWLSRNIRT